MARAASNGRVLTNGDATLVKGMISRGDRQHDIAAFFAVNGGRIGETSTGANFAHVVAATTNLPPRAPYLVISAAMRPVADDLRTELVAAGANASSLVKLDQIIAAMEASRVARRGK